MTDTSLFKENMASQSKTELVELVKILVDKYGEEALKLVHDHCASTNAAKKVVQGCKKQERKAHNESDRAKNDKKFDFSQYRQRRVAIQLQYDGGPYFGFASQVGECEETVEKHLFEALHKVKLIESRQKADYNRCGRTDAGVSAFGQVIGLNVRSNFPLDTSLIVFPDDPDGAKTAEERERDFVLPAHPCDTLQVMKICKDKKRGDQIRIIETREIDYCHLLNRILPPTIRAISWKPVTSGFNARFSAGARTYRYFFVNRRYRDGSVQFDLDRMSKAVALMVGKHDFRNFCKIDITAVSNFERTIYSAEIRPFCSGISTSCEGLEIDRTDGSSPGGGFMGSEGWWANGKDHVVEENVYMLEISGLAFLWHMVRCIMSILFMVGAGLEEPGIVTDLLDIEKYPGKPTYNFAPEKPLVLHKCHFDRLQFNFHSPRVLWNLNQHYSGLLEHHMLAAARCKNAMQQVQAMQVRDCDVEEFLAGLIDGGRDVLRAGLAAGAGAFAAAVVRICMGKSEESGAGDANDDCGSDPSASKRARLEESPAVCGSEVASTSSARSIASAGSSSLIDRETVPLYELIALLKEFGVEPASNCLNLRTGNHQPLAQVRRVLFHCFTPICIFTNGCVFSLCCVICLQRPTADSYEQRASNVTGIRAGRMNRHLELKGKAHELDPHFFHKMRAEGHEE
jgi:tRNA pseudouridine38/39 synthase